jgi:hypothetical protein
VDRACNEGEWYDSFSDRLEWDEIDTTEGEDVEEAGAEPAGWSHASGIGFDDWAPADDNNHTTGGAWSWFTPVTSAVRDTWLISPDYALTGTEDMVATLEFWHTRALDSGTDGGTLEISTDAGATWNPAGAYITEGGYNDTFNNSTHPMDGMSVWAGNSGWMRTSVNLTTFRGETVRFRWRLGSSFFGTGSGWWIDDVVVSTHDEPCDASACGVPGEVVLDSASKEDGDAILGWWDDPLCVDFRVWRSTDPSSAGSFVDVTAEDPDSTDCVFRDTNGGAMLYFIIEAIGPDGDGPWGHFGQ